MTTIWDVLPFPDRERARPDRNGIGSGDIRQSWVSAAGQQRLQFASEPRDLPEPKRGRRSIRCIPLLSGIALKSDGVRIVLMGAERKLR